jgi:hypothetical protein
MTANPIVCIISFLGPRKRLLPQGRQPRRPQGQRCGAQGAMPREDQQVATRRQLSSGLSGQLTEEALGAIAHNGSPQTFAHDHAHSRIRQVGTAGHEVEQRSWKPSAGFFDALDIAALFEKKQAVFRRTRRGPHATRSGACAPSCGGEPGLCARLSFSFVSETHGRVSVSVSKAVGM